MHQVVFGAKISLTLCHNNIYVNPALNMQVLHYNSRAVGHRLLLFDMQEERNLLIVRNDGSWRSSRCTLKGLSTSRYATMIPIYTDIW